MKPLNHNYKPNYETIEDKLNSNPQPQEKANKTDKSKTLKSILDTSEFYKNCVYCGRIYEDDYDKVIYQNGSGPLTEEFNDYQISTGVGPCCMDIYRKRLEEVMEYNPKKYLSEIYS